MKPASYPSAEFGFDRSCISEAALEVIDGLQDAGFDGYLVGGCVRDLLLGSEPKDFDVTTDANPEQVRKLFRRARIIGRRFRLVHVRHGREVIEVATYRADPNQNSKRNWLGWAKSSKPNNGRILDDNVYGSIEDDAIRRDFTANALYYDPNSEQVLDFVGGVEDIRQHQLRMIGKPANRFAEDPVRMLRVLRFQAKLGLQPDSSITNAIMKQRGLIRDVPAARLFDEVLKMFHHAHGVKSWHLLQDFGFNEFLFRQTADALVNAEDDRWHRFIELALENTDRRISQGKPVIPAFLYAVLLWMPFNHHYHEVRRPKMSHNEQVWQAGEIVFAEQSRAIAVPRRVSTPAIEIWLMQGILERRRPKTIHSLLENRRFRAAYDFLLLRSRVGEVDSVLVEWWTDIQDQDHAGKQQMIDALQPRRHGPQGARKKRSRRRRSPRKKPVSDQ